METPAEIDLPMGNTTRICGLLICIICKTTLSSALIHSFYVTNEIRIIDLPVVTKLFLENQTEAPLPFILRAAKCSKKFLQENHAHDCRKMTAMLQSKNGSPSVCR